ncbi:MAG: GNAT family N-acetyltransferase [Rhodoferax sp.]|uniref:GNAT family N-acetyltransferase n=1 Tax=Rhodoferax sp. TaxID=50421 RepID=UPI00263563C7|nr:GNAT family N-acetyltransferase [Rhodoferax sp.]MDD2879057.1 GNAT family N-acetyltransferase [Rhodoferax sp.]
MGNNTPPEANDYVIRVMNSPQQVDADQWDALLFAQADATPFMQHAYLSALHTSACATPHTGWSPRFMLLEHQGQLVAACALYLKTHSRGEYVFDFGWANAYEQHGLAYYPKAVVAVPFTPVPGARLLARNAQDRGLLAQGLIEWCDAQGVSGLHCLFASADDLQACQTAGMMQRHTVQFHWENSLSGYADFDGFLASLAADKRKKIRQERRKVLDAGVSFRHAQGRDISASDWDFFYRCYERTYLEHGNAPYLNRAFFAAMATHMPDDWLLFTAERAGQPIATSLIAINASCTKATGQKDYESLVRVAYGRYWGALERVDCLHFEACYYQPLAWCIANGYTRFEGGAQGEHKLARALLPVKTTSAHWLAHPAFANAVNDFLNAEGQGVAQYLDELKSHSPFKSV